MQIKRFGVLSCAKVAGVLYGGMGLFFGAIITMVSLAGMAFGGGSNGGGDAFLGLIFGGAAVILLPLFYGGLAFVFTAIGAALYNLIAKFIGGIEVELV